MAEPRYASEDWRWVTSEDGLYKKLVAGPEPLPVPRVVLACGNIDAEDADGIRAMPKLYAIGRRVQSMLEDHEDPAPDVVEQWDRLYEDLTDALAAARGEGVPDA